jgi:nucleotide-binding universal stress UspA family protein
MSHVVLLCVDGSEDSVAAARTGLDRLAPAERTIVATVVEAGDPMLVAGASGMAGGAMSPEQFTEMEEARAREGEAVVADAVASLGLDGAETRVLVGAAGPELAALAADEGATVLVVGSRGRGGIKRALLGSVSDHLVRNAGCPVLVVRDEVED